MQQHIRPRYPSDYIVFEPKYTQFKHARDLYKKLINIFNDEDFSILRYDRTATFLYLGKDNEWSNEKCAWRWIISNHYNDVIDWTFQIEFKEKEHLLLYNTILKNEISL